MMNWNVRIDLFKSHKTHFILLLIVLFLTLVSALASAEKCEQIHLGPKTLSIQPLSVSSYTELVGIKNYTSTAEGIVGKVFFFQPLESNATQFPAHKGTLELYRKISG